MLYFRKQATLPQRVKLQKLSKIVTVTLYDSLKNILYA